MHAPSLAHLYIVRVDLYVTSEGRGCISFPSGTPLPTGGELASRNVERLYISSIALGMEIFQLIDIEMFMDLGTVTAQTALVVL